MRRNRPHIPRDFLYEPCSPRYPVARAIATGDRWFYAWAFQYALNGPRLKKMAGITSERAEQLHHGAAVTQAEVEALALACGVQPSDIIASLPDPSLLATACQ
jgi:hypothetical protein